MAERRPRSRKTPTLKGRTSPKKTGGKKKPKTKKAADPHAAVRRYRERMRAKGYRPVTIWAPDLSNPDFVRKLQAGVAAVAEYERTNPSAREEAEFWEKASAEIWEDEPDYDWGPNGPPKG